MILRMGAFHTSMTFLAVIRKRFEDAGLSDLFVEYCAYHGTMLALASDRTAAVTLSLGLEGLKPMLEQHWLWVLWRCE